VYERERGISEWLVRKVEEIYVRIKNKVKVGEKEGEWFETTKGVRQCCPAVQDIRGGRGRNVEESASGRSRGGQGESFEPGVCGRHGNCGKE
jgi:hypothetical protein